MNSWLTKHWEALLITHWEALVITHWEGPDFSRAIKIPIDAGL